LGGTVCSATFLVLDRRTGITKREIIMDMSQLAIHVMADKAPKIMVEKYDDFCTVEIKTNTSPAVKFFLCSSQKNGKFQK
jgi:hypothetical protein